MADTIEFSVLQGDITEFEADVIALKYARAFYGADKAVAKALMDSGISEERLKPAEGRARYVPGNNAIGAGHALFVGVPYLSQFTYSHVRDFTRRVLGTLATRAQTTSHLAMTIHGANVRSGLDVDEAFLAQFIVCLTAAHRGELPAALKRISIVDHNPNTARELRITLDNFLSTSRDVVRTDTGYRLPVGGQNENSRPHVFVAMSFDPTQTDTFYFGMQWPILAAGYRCERVDQSSYFHGDVIDRIRYLIDNAELVIADLTQLKPNVFLEVGFAWGAKKPCLMLINQAQLASQKLPFDVQTHRCIVYSGPQDLREQLSLELNKYRHVPA